LGQISCGPKGLLGLQIAGGKAALAEGQRPSDVQQWRKAPDQGGKAAAGPSE